MITIVYGDILEATENFICHQVNCKGVMGSGLALQVRQKYYEVYEDYLKEVNNAEKDPEILLGTSRVVGIGNDQYIINMFGQDGFSREGIDTDYEALKACLVGIKQIAEQMNFSIALPYKIGCGLGGGDWNIVYGMIEEVFEDYDVSIYNIEDEAPEIETDSGTLGESDL